ncbi:MAG TPA: 16S rRNA (guanine(966)-N(2))-methyltransferase RsmD [Bryobacteraceae bacterium]|jgi:16S rRNA (guanine(966)-N(2))-methyltransferase RsmD|nr:16S rRNA (guanine(966)-N(2))-methyltransferase RsmD [Bryobacteraceae bacterium]
MRVIGGRFRSRKLKPVPGMMTRPTPDRLREALFNVLTPRIDGKVFLDGYAGTGAVAIEALSRGARHAIVIERNAEAVRVLRDNLESLGLGTEATVVRGAAVAKLRDYACDIAFLDPPYEQSGDYAACLSILAESDCGLAIAQHSSRVTLGENYGRLTRRRVLKQGDNSLSFYE